MSRCPPPRPRPPRPASASGYPPGPGTAGRIWPRSPSDSAGGSPTSTVSCPTERSCGCAGCATPVTPARGGLRSTGPATTTTKTASCPADPPQAAPKKPSTARVGSTSTTLLPGRPIHHRRTNGQDHWLKLEGLLRTIAAVEELAVDRPVQLVVVGEGSAAAQVQARADEVNARTGRRVVVLTGGLVDPRPAYAAADVVVGMGSSALRALAFGKPLVVVGEHGFSQPFTPETAGVFTRQGFYGLGPGVPAPDPLVGQLQALLDDAAERS